MKPAPSLHPRKRGGFFSSAPLLPFGSALTLAVVLLMAVPGGLGAVLLLRQSVQETREEVVSALQQGAQNAANQLRRELELLVTRSRTLSFDSDLQMGTRSVLFFERIEQRLGSYNAETPLSQGAWFFGSEGVLVATSPQELELGRPFPFQDAFDPWLAGIKENQAARQRHAFFAVSAPREPGLFLFTPVRDFLGSSAGAVVTFVPTEALEKLLQSELASSDGVLVAIQTGAAPSESQPATPTSRSETEGTTGKLVSEVVNEDTLLSRVDAGGLRFEIRQNFRARIEAVWQRNAMLMAVLSAGLLFLGLSAFSLARIFVRPFEPLRGIVRAFGQGHYDVAKPTVAFLEFQEFVDTLFAMAGEIQTRIQERELLARRDADLKREQMSAELAALRSQMNPHFLFNALNSVQSLLDIDAGAARGMLQQLSDLFREILESSKLTTIPLDREMRIVESYLALQKRRFGKRLSYAFDIPAEASHIYVPPLLIQTLVENAVKHGIEASREGGVVRVHVAPLMGTPGYECHVFNEGNGERQPQATRRSSLSTPDKEGTGTGLANTRRRLELLYGEGWRFELLVDEQGDARASFLFTGTRLEEGR
ncbi:MAG: histidine kinase [Silvanigrellales bacterium]|nr:histidine kinase [Silvanigrellales bacterium]